MDPLLETDEGKYVKNHVNSTGNPSSSSSTTTIQEEPCGLFIVKDQQ
jgi:hypothetical protein